MSPAIGPVIAPTGTAPFQCASPMLPMWQAPFPASPLGSPMFPPRQGLASPYFPTGQVRASSPNGEAPGISVQKAPAGSPVQQYRQIPAGSPVLQTRQIPAVSQAVSPLLPLHPLKSPASPLLLQRRISGEPPVRFNSGELPYQHASLQFFAPIGMSKLTTSLSVAIEDPTVNRMRSCTDSAVPPYKEHNFGGSQLVTTGKDTVPSAATSPPAPAPLQQAVSRPVVQDVRPVAKAKVKTARKSSPSPPGRSGSSGGAWSKTRSQSETLDDLYTRGSNAGGGYAGGVFGPPPAPLCKRASKAGGAVSPSGPSAGALCGPTSTSTKQRGRTETGSSFSPTRIAGPAKGPAPRKSSPETRTRPGHRPRSHSPEDAAMMHAG